MEAALQDPPSLPTSEDDDLYNTDNARIHFGPLRTPERKIAAMLGPPRSATPDPTPPHARLDTQSSGDIQRETSPEAEDSEDVDRVQELIGGDDDGDDVGALDEEIPFSADYVDDEPSSALALRISVARDNPSPPPSPAKAAIESELTSEGQSPADSTTDDPTVPESSSNLQDLSTPFETRSPSSPPPEDHDMAVDPVSTKEPSPQPDLMTFETSFTTLEIPPSSMTSAEEIPDSAVSVVDALLTISPSTESFARPSSQVPDILPAILEPNDTQAQADGQEMAVVESSSSGLEGSLSQMSELTLPPPTPPPEQQLRRSPRKSVASAIPRAPNTPRPSLRSPRKSRIPASESVTDSQDEGDGVEEERHTPQPQGQSHSLPLQPPDSAMKTPRAKERAMSRGPLPFNREVGSLSPGTSELLTELIPSFTDTTPLQLSTEPSSSSSVTPEMLIPSQPTHSFSVFSAAPTSGPSSAQMPSTPKRSTSPMRPTGFGTPSPSKFRMQMMQGDANVNATPARRITIEKALETGQISPLKASQMGFAPSMQTPVPSMPQTPARRVLITDKDAGSQPGITTMPSAHPPSTASSKQPTLRFGTPGRGRSVEPASTSQGQPSAPASSSLVGSSSSISTTQASGSGSHAPNPARTTTVFPTGQTTSGAAVNGAKTAKLPYPFTVASTEPSPSAASGSGAAGPEPAGIKQATQHQQQHHQPLLSTTVSSSPAKSSLKQPTSRIPRIGAKPYARPPGSAGVAAKAKVGSSQPATGTAAATPVKPVAIRKVDLSKPGNSRMVNSRGVSGINGAPTAGPGKINLNGKEPGSTLRAVPPAGGASSTGHGVNGVTAAPSGTTTAPSAIKRKRSSPDKVLGAGAAAGGGGGGSSPVKSRMPSRQAKTATAGAGARVGGAGTVAAGAGGSGSTGSAGLKASGAGAGAGAAMGATTKPKPRTIRKVVLENPVVPASVTSSSSSSAPSPLQSGVTESATAATAAAPSEGRANQVSPTTGEEHLSAANTTTTTTTHHLQRDGNAAWESAVGSPMVEDPPVVGTAPPNFAPNHNTHAPSQIPTPIVHNNTQAAPITTVAKEVVGVDASPAMETPELGGAAAAAAPAPPAGVRRTSRLRKTVVTNVDYGFLDDLEQQQQQLSGGAAAAANTTTTTSRGASTTHARGGSSSTAGSRRKASSVASASSSGGGGAGAGANGQAPRFHFTDAYSGMSVTALKQLTLANTTRNQHYVSARLETQVVVKDGARPESPMVKIKTVAQREEEMREVRRAERAMRRARRSGESESEFDVEGAGGGDAEGGRGRRRRVGESDEEMGSGSSDEDEDDGVGMGKGKGKGKGGLFVELPPHTRGAGEDEEYKTPDRAFKRMRLGAGGRFEDENTDRGMDVDHVGDRRVKWDRGLYTTVYLDEIFVGTREPMRELGGRKGCLAPKAKALRLDTLGNLNGADEPIPEVMPQHVTVKKFVYDGEVVEEPVQPVHVDPPQPKVTRSRSKKGRS